MVGPIAAVRIVRIVQIVQIVRIVPGRDGTTGQSLSDAADPADTPMLEALNVRLEGRTARLKTPQPPASLAWIVARLGGWSGYTSKGYKPAGPKTIARGLIRRDGRIKGWNPARSANVRLP